MAEQDTLTAAFILSLIGGLLILLSGIMILAMGTAFAGMMGGYYHGMMGYPITVGISPVLAGIGTGGVICGIIILAGAYQVNTRPSSHTLWGIVIIVVSAVSLFEGGGFLIGAILGMIGGILAITWKPPMAGAEAKGSD